MSHKIILPDPIHLSLCLHIFAPSPSIISHHFVLQIYVWLHSFRPSLPRVTHSDGHTGQHWQWSSGLQGRRGRIAFSQLLWQYTGSYQGGREGKEKRMYSFFKTLWAANTLSLVERQISLHHQPFFTSKALSPQQTSWSNVSLSFSRTKPQIQEQRAQRHSVVPVPGRSEWQRRSLNEHCRQGWVTEMSLFTTMQLKATIIGQEKRARPLRCQVGAWRI